MAICNYCLGEFPDNGEIGQGCPICGCDAETCRLGRSKSEKIENGVRSAPRIISVLAIFGPVAILGLIMTAIFGNDPNRLLIAFTIIVILSFVGMIVYGVVRRKRDKARFHGPDMVVTKGKVVNFHITESISTSIIEYEVGGQKYRYVSKSEKRAHDKEGDEADIAYRASNPLDNFLVDDNSGHTFIMAGIIGLAIIAFVAIICLVASVANGK